MCWSDAYPSSRVTTQLAGLQQAPPTGNASMAECILIVDDEPLTREMHVEALTLWGYNAVVAQDGVEALRKVAEHSPDLVVSDLRMPRMSGFELLSALRVRYPEILVICVSGVHDTLTASPNVVCDAFLLKGQYEMHELRDKISELLRGPRRAPLIQGSAPPRLPS